MSIQKIDRQDWHEVGIDAAYYFYRYANARTIGEQVTAFEHLSNAMAGVKSYLPGYDDNCTMPWERGEDIESDEDLNVYYK